MCVMLLLDEILCRCLLKYHLILKFLCWVFVWMTYLLVTEGTEVCHYYCIFKFNSVCLMKLGKPTWGAYKLTIVISSWCIVHFISMKWPSLSLFINLCLKSTLSDISIATPTCFQGPFACFTLSQCLFLSMRWIPWRQQIVRCCF
jgi:hypothetical protein